MTGSPYKALKAAGCEIGSHESDLHVKVTTTSTAILGAYREWVYGTFRSAIDRSLWYDIPFAYDPWWDNCHWQKAAAD